MIVVAVDSEVDSGFKPLKYATEIFTKLQKYMLTDIFPELYKNLAGNQISILNDRMKIEHSLRHIFKKDE